MNKYEEYAEQMKSQPLERLEAVNAELQAQVAETQAYQKVVKRLITAREQEARAKRLVRQKDDPKTQGVG